MHHKFIPEDITVNERYKKMLIHLWEAICLKLPKMWVIKDWVFLHNNTMAHQMLLVQQHITRLDTVKLLHSLHSTNFRFIPLYKDEGPAEGLSFQGGRRD